MKECIAVYEVLENDVSKCQPTRYDFFIVFPTAGFYRVPTSHTSLYVHGRSRNKQPPNGSSIQ